MRVRSLEMWTGFLGAVYGLGTVCSVTDGAPPTGGGGGAPPAGALAGAAAGAAANAPAAPPPAAPPPPVSGPNVAEVMAQNQKLQTELQAATAKMADPAFHKEILKTALGTFLGGGEDQDPKAKVEALSQKASHFETLAKRTALANAVITEAWKHNAHAPEDVAALVDLTGVDLTPDLRVKDPQAVAARVAAFRASRPHMFRDAAAAAAVVPPGAPPAQGIPVGTTPPPAAGATAGEGEFRVLSNEELYLLPLEKQREYRTKLQATRDNATPWHN